MALRLTEAQVGLLKVDNVNSRTANTALYITGGSTVYLSSASNSPLIMRMGEAEVARVSTKGNFIIGADDVTTTDYKLKVTGATGFNNGHLYLTGASPSSSTAGTTQLVFGEPGNNHVVVSSNTKALVINPTTTTTTNQIVLYLDQHSLFPSGIKTTSTTDSTSTTTGSIITSGGIGVAKNIYSGQKINAAQGFGVNATTGTGVGISLYNGSNGTSAPTYGLMFAKTANFGTHGSVSGDWATYFTMSETTTKQRGWIFRHTSNNVASISGAGDLSLSGTLTHTGQYFYQSGDATMKFYPQTNTTHAYESIAIQTCFDSQDGSSSAYVTSYENRCNLLLQPRGGQVYIGVNHTTLGDTTNSLIVGGNAKITNLLTTGSGSSHYGIKVGDTYINAINGSLILQNNGAIRFGADDWDWNVWAGLKYDSANKCIYLGLADGSIFTANANQSGGTLALPGISYFSVNGKRVISAADTWLRINDGSAFSSGIYMGTSLVRTDGQFQVGSGGSAFYAKSDGTGYFKSNLKVDGKLIMTGNIAYTNGTNQYDVVRFVTGDENGAGLVLGGGGVVVIGCGESAYNFQGSSGANVAGNTETTYITSDNGIEFYTNCQTIGSRVGVILNVSRHFYPNVNNTGSLGTSSYKWSTGYFYGSVNAGSVWAAHQTGGESNIGASFASGKNLYLYANNSSGARGLYDSNKGSIISVTDSAATFYGHASSGGYLTSNIVFTPAETALTPANVKSLIGSGSQIRKGTWNYAGNGYIPSGSTATTQCPFGAIDLAGTTVIQSTTGTEYTQVYITPPTSNTSGAIKGEMLYYIDQGSGYSPTWYRVLTNNNYSSYALPLSGGTLSANAAIKFPATAGSIATSDPMAITYGRIAAYGTLHINANTDNSGTEYVILTAGKGHSSSTADGLAVGTSTLTWQGATVMTSSNYSSWAAPVSHSHNYLDIKGTNTIASGSGDTTAAWGALGNNTTWWYSDAGTLTDKPSSWGFIWQLSNGTDVNQLWFAQSGGVIKRRSGNASGWNGTWRQIWQSGDSITGAVWNDYAEYRESSCEEPGRVLFENGDDTLSMTTKRLQHFAGVSSDTWGFCQGETKKAKTPIAVAGRVLVYTYQDRNNYKPGDCVCAAPGGTVDIMTREEIIQYPDRIVGTVSCVPEYSTWGSGDRDPVDVNGRIWIKVI